MILQLQEIPESGFVLRYDLPPGEMDLRSEGVHCSGAIAVDLVTGKIKNLISLDGKISTLLDLECGKCLRKFRQPLKVDVRAHFLPESSQYEDDESLDQSIEVLLYSGESIDLDHIVQEYILLSLPFRPLCKESCLGLCMNCGKDLNDGRCGCEIEAPNRSFSVLHNFFQDVKKS